MSHVWDGATYDRISTPQAAWGERVLERLKLRGDETVLDAGCGSGRVTEMLLERLPDGRVLAVDASESMARAARNRLAGRAEVHVLDLLDLELDDLGLDQPLDAVVSTATFHWIADHDRLYRRIRATLRDGGSLVAQCGGEGNVEAVHAVARTVGELEPFAAHLARWRGPWNFTSAVQAEHSLRVAGFSEARCWLEPAPVQPPEPREFLRSVILGPHLARLPQPLREPFLEAVHERLGDAFTIDYVRLNMDAIG